MIVVSLVVGEELGFGWVGEFGVVGGVDDFEGLFGDLVGFVVEGGDFGFVERIGYVVWVEGGVLEDFVGYLVVDVGEVFLYEEDGFDWGVSVVL